MFKTRPCGCKGLRSCKICELEYGAWKIKENISKENSYVFCPYCKKLWPGWDVNSYKLHPHHLGEPIDFSGVEILTEFINRIEETELLKNIDEVPWNLSQSGRYKQNYGPKCNFKKRKVSSKSFNGYPQFTEFIQQRFKEVPLLESFETVEQCSLEYISERGSSIDPHIDDCWIWGERIPTLSLESDSVLTLTEFEGPIKRYNLIDAAAYPRVVENGKVKTWDRVGEELKGLMEWEEGSVNEGEKENGNEDKSGNGYDKEKQKNEIQNENPDTFNKQINNDTTDKIKETDTPESDNISRVIRLPMPARSLIILFGDARYKWEHAILREDILERRVCITYRELTPPFFHFGSRANDGEEILKRSKCFWDHTQVKST